MNKGQAKQRKNRGNKDKAKTQSPSKKEDKKDAKKSTDAQEEEEKEQTLWETFREHPLIVVAPWVLIPYFLYSAYFYVLLQRPDLLAPIGIHLRPAVAIHEPRQVLIMGSMSSGTVQVANDLSTLLKLEIGHESSDSQSEFVRDGTVSWFHVLRYTEPPTNPVDAVVAYKHLCGELTPSMGFHPAMYRQNGGCSKRVKWDACWKKECFEIVQREWGCALPATQQQCETPFAKNLHQIRHPLRTIESLVVKFCQGSELDTGVITPEFVQFAEALFGRAHHFEDDHHSCVEAAAHYVLEYNRALLAARTALDGSFRIEETSACDIAQLAGFLDKDKRAIYPPSNERVAKLCGDFQHPANQYLQSTKHKRNANVVELNWEDFRGGKHGSTRPAGDTSLEQALKDLTRELGYDVE